jgi:uncharacterized membrane protein
MNARNLKIALAVSVAVNVFAVAALVTGKVGEAVIERRVAEAEPARRGLPVMAVVDTLDPAVQDTVRASLRAAALAARPDFQEARETRRQAIERARSEPFDAPAVTVLMIQSREAEARGRAILETEAVRVLSTLEPEDRAKLAPILSRHGNRGRGEQRRQPAPSSSGDEPSS